VKQVREGHAHISANMPEDVFTDRPKVDRAMKGPSMVMWMSASKVYFIGCASASSHHAIVEPSMHQRHCQSASQSVMHPPASKKKVKKKTPVNGIFCLHMPVGTHEPNKGAVILPRCVLGKKLARGRLRDDGDACDGSEGIRRRRGEDFVYRLGCVGHRLVGYRGEYLLVWFGCR
jgi:hypothetical protein